MQLSVKGNTIIDNLYDEQSTRNHYRAKVAAVQALEDRVKKAEKDWAYADMVQEAIMQVKTPAGEALAVSEATKKKAKESLTRMYNMYKKIEAE